MRAFHVAIFTLAVVFSFQAQALLDPSCLEVLSNQPNQMGVAMLEQILNERKEIAKMTPQEFERTTDLTGDRRQQAQQEVAALEHTHPEDVQHDPILEEVLPNPYQFIAEIRRRFKEQKAKDPSNALGFNVMDLPGYKQEIELARKNTAKEILELKAIRHQIETNPKVFRGNHSMRSWRAATKRQLEMIAVGIEYLEHIQRDLQKALDADFISYGAWNKISSFYSRAMGYFDLYSITLVERYFLKIEMKIQGYERFSIEEEYHNYRVNDYSLIGRNASINKSIEKAGNWFEEQYWNNDELPFILIPSHAYLNMDVFHYLMPKDIYLIGLTPTPLRADGFNRPPGVFYLHDILHAALIAWTKSLYIKRNDITPIEEIKLDRAMERWLQALNAAIDATEDQHTRIIRDRTAFNIHHDRGFPLAPSIFLALEKPPGTLKSLYRLLRHFGNHDLKIDATTKEVLDSFYWLKNFWKQFEKEEEDILGRPLRMRREPL